MLRRLTWVHLRKLHGARFLEPCLWVGTWPQNLTAGGKKLCPIFLCDQKHNVESALQCSQQRRNRFLGRTPSPTQRPNLEGRILGYDCKLKFEKWHKLFSPCRENCRFSSDTLNLNSSCSRTHARWHGMRWTPHSFILCVPFLLPCLLN